MTPRSQPHGPNLPGRAGRYRGDWDTGPSRHGELVDPACPRTRARVTRDSWSTLGALGQGTDSPGTAGQPRVLSDPIASPPGVLVGSSGPRTWACVTWCSWSTPRAQRHGPNWAGRAGRYRGHWDTGQSCQGEQVDPVCPRTRARVTWDSWSSRGPWDKGLIRPEELSTLQALGPKRESPGGTGRPRGTWDSSTSRPG